ncbi:zinc finger and BTB domain-containing protein 11-like isoform X1 [Oratosquilla oratoria]|uniref:zinc finger and BTB domain-containing protein 11-like isoform X1 n=1 Tax=Oratosquilla oratoria TaxID=337810 RepID=UPI003F765012
MDFHTEMDEVEEFLRSKKYPVHVGNNKGKKANFRRKCQAFTIQDDCLKYVHKPNRKDITEVRFLRVIKDRQYQLDIVLASHRGSGYSDESVALGGHVGREKVVDRIMQRYWWRKIVSDVNETIKTCLRCQKSSTVFKKVDSKLHSIPIKPQIMHQIGIDLCSLTNSSSDPPSPTSLSEPPSPIVQIIGVQQQEIIYKFNPITVAT